MNNPTVELEMIQNGEVCYGMWHDCYYMPISERRMFTSKLDLQRFVLLKDILIGFEADYFGFDYKLGWYPDGKKNIE